jgi:hypothetical protein
MRSLSTAIAPCIEFLDPWLFFLITSVVALSLPPDVHAQPSGNRPAPHLAFTYPAGGQQGTTVKVSVGGQHLNATAAAHFSGRGLTAKVFGYERPLTQKEINDLREEQQALQDKRVATRTDPTKPPFTAEDEKRVTDLRVLLASRGNRQISPVLAETVTLEITVTPDAPLGERELRLRTPSGLSNPLVFSVGQLPEISEPVRIATAIPNSAKPNREIDPRTHRPKTEIAITLPTVVNGQILPGEVDRFPFSATKGQRLVMVASARSLLPYLADAVPGWFQATLGLLDVHGRELAFADDYRFNPDPVLCYDIPADGTYVVEIKDAIFRGREDFVYRITLGELPFVTGIFPLGATCGDRVSFDLTGWNLPADKLVLDTKDKPPGTFLVSVRRHEQVSNSVRLTLDHQRAASEAEPNDRAVAPQLISLPLTINGRIGQRSDQDVFRFAGKAGDEIVAEVFARRLGSPLDSVLKLTDEAGQQLAFNDDHEDKAAALLTHHADSRLTCKLPADGAYYLTIADTQHQGGADYGYRLCVGPPRPDFALRIAPSSINVRAGASTAVTVFALRDAGFNGEIQLQLREAPWGFGLSGGRIPAGQDKVQVTVTAPFNANDEVFTISMVGLATINGQLVGHPAVPAEDMMQAFAYKHLVASKELMVNVAGRGAPFRVITKAPLRLTPGGTARVQIAAPAARSAGKVQFELIDPPEGISVEGPLVRTGDTITVVVTCDLAKAKPGMQGNLLLTGFGERPNPTTKAKGVQRVPLGAVPAIAFEVVAPLGPST